MKQLLLICAAVALVGCGEKKPEISNPIEKAIRLKLKKPTGELTKADLEKVTELSFFFQQLTDVKGLEKLPKLGKLNFYDSQLDVKGLENLTQLRMLALHNNQLTSVKGLEKLTKLEFLNLKHNPALTKTQIAELQKALPKCEILSNPTK